MWSVSRYAFFGLVLISGFCAVAEGQRAGDTFVQGLVPDWDQPLDYPDPPGFDPTGPIPGDPFWMAWCGPSAAAGLIGHWEDVKGRNGLADGSADGNPFKVPPGYVGPPYGGGPGWHDFTADGNPAGLPGPNPMRGAQPVDDLGVYMDTNGHMTAMPHAGTFYKDMAPGLNGFLNAVDMTGSLAANSLEASTWGVHPVFGAWTLPQMISALKAEVDGNRTAMAHFRHWNILLNGPQANPGSGDEESEDAFEVEDYIFGDWTPGGCHGEDWNGYEGEDGLGHAALVVGYTTDNAGKVTDLIVHDNWPMTQRNVKVPVGPQLVAVTLVKPMNRFVQGLAPDWNQPLAYPDLYDPMNGPPAADPFWNAWCAPTAASCLIGHWEDVKGRAGLSDGSADGNQYLPNGYGGPPYGKGAAWHDYNADGNGQGMPGPHPKRGNRLVEDFGFYMDTNGTGILGVAHVGTFYKDVGPGLNRFFKAKGRGFGQPAQNLWARTIGIHWAFGFVSFPMMVDKMKFEIDSNRTVIAHFRHWNLVPIGPPAMPGTGNETEEYEFDMEDYTFGDAIPGGCHGEVWNQYEGENGLGHSVLVVGYTLDVWGNLTHVIVHDNWFLTQRNVKVPVGPQLVAVTVVRGKYAARPKVF